MKKASATWNKKGKVRVSPDLVALYMRVSGDRQEREASIDTQEHYLREYCRKEGLTIVRVYKDQAVQNETPFDRRPEGHRLFEDAKAGVFGRVVIYHSTRWSWNHLVFAEWWGNLRALGVELTCMTEFLSGETLENEYVSDLQLRNNKLFHDFINRNFIRGRYRRASEGGYTGGWVGYGWEKAPAPEYGEKRKKYVLWEPEAKIVRWIFHLCVVEQLSCIQIAARLNAEGIPSPAFSDKPSAARHAQRTRAGRRPPSGLWNRAAVRKILRNEAYAGSRLYGGGYQEAVQHPHPAIVDRETFLAAGVQLEQNASLADRNTGEEHVYLFKGKLICPVHESVFSGYRVSDGPNAKYHHRTPCWRYRCNRWSERSKSPHGPEVACPFPTLDARRWEADLWENLVAHLLDQEGTVARLEAQLATEESEEQRLLKQQNALLRQREELDDEYRLALRGKNRIGMDLTPDQAAEVIAAVGAERDRLTEPLATLKEQIERARHEERRLEAAGNMIERYAKRLEGPLTDKEKQQIVATFLVEARPEIGPDGQGEMVYTFCFDDTAERAIASSGTGALVLQSHTALCRKPNPAALAAA